MASFSMKTTLSKNATDFVLCARSSAASYMGSNQSQAQVNATQPTKVTRCSDADVEVFAGGRGINVGRSSTVGLLFSTASSAWERLSRSSHSPNSPSRVPVDCGNAPLIGCTLLRPHKMCGSASNLPSRPTAQSGRAESGWKKTRAFFFFLNADLAECGLHAAKKIRCGEVHDDAEKIKKTFRMVGAPHRANHYLASLPMNRRADTFSSLNHHLCLHLHILFYPITP